MTATVLVCGERSLNLPDKPAHFLQIDDKFRVREIVAILKLTRRECARSLHATAERYIAGTQ